MLYIKAEERADRIPTVQLSHKFNRALRSQYDRGICIPLRPQSQNLRRIEADLLPIILLRTRVCRRVNTRFHIDIVVLYLLQIEQEMSVSAIHRRKKTRDSLLKQNHYHRSISFNRL